jgi:capsular exopolysaccharide synthesis family protein
MAKTYEALVKSKKRSEISDLPSVSVFEVPSPDLSSDKQMVDLNYMIDLKSKQDNLRVINFVSSHSGEGTTTVVVNFIRFLLETEASSEVLLIDANLHHPSLHLEFNIPPSPGLNDVLWNKAKLSDAVFKIGSSNIYLVPSGSSLSFDPSNIESKRYSTIFSQLNKNFKYLFIDSPPLLDSSVALVLASIADMTFIVIQAHRTQWEVAVKAKNYLNHYNCDIGGVILNRVLQPIPEWIYKRL